VGKKKTKWPGERETTVSRLRRDGKQNLQEREPQNVLRQKRQEKGGGIGVLRRR